MTVKFIAIRHVDVTYFHSSYSPQFYRPILMAVRKERNNNEADSSAVRDEQKGEVP